MDPMGFEGLLLTWKGAYLIRVFFFPPKKSALENDRCVNRRAANEIVEFFEGENGVTWGRVWVRTLRPYLDVPGSY